MNKKSTIQTIRKRMVAEVRRSRPLRFVAGWWESRCRSCSIGSHRAMEDDWTSGLVQSDAGESFARKSDFVPSRRLSAVDSQVSARGSALGEHGPQAIHREMLRRRFRNVPAVRTIARVLERRGALDGQRRVRRTPPPPPVGSSGRGGGASRRLDSFDIVEDLVIAGGHDVNVLAMSLHGGCCNAWPRRRIHGENYRDSLIEHWRRPRPARIRKVRQRHGLPEHIHPR